jgi:hypothetical protein
VTSARVPSTFVSAGTLLGTTVDRTRSACRGGREVMIVEAFLLLPWRAAPAALLALGGVLLVTRGVRAFVAARAATRDPERALAVARSFRIGIAGLCCLVFAIAWIASLGWLAILALIVLGEEMLETSVMVAALEDGRRRAGPRPA